MNNTIFDDVFRTMIEKMPRLAISLINEVFKTAYPDDVKMIQWRNEHEGKNGEVITDSCLRIGDKVYHFECQSADDRTMAIRMIEYDFAIALEFNEKKGRDYILRFPHSAVLQLRSSKSTLDYLEVKVIFPDEKLYDYRIPVIKIENYTKEDIFQKKLFMLLPFYIIRYEKRKKQLEKHKEELYELLEEYEYIRKQLEQSREKSDLYMNMITLIKEIANYIFREEENIRKGLGDVMGGQILELESERLEALGQKKLLTLISLMTENGREAELSRLSSDPEFLAQMMKVYHLDEKIK